MANAFNFDDGEVNKMPQGRKDPRVAGTIPTMGRGETQIDGNVTTQFSPPTKGAGLVARSAFTSQSTDSGVQRSMADLADQLHPPKRR